LQTVLQQLSSGSRINSGADDSAGLSLVNGLQANSTALTQSKTNATEGVGLLEVADGALSQVTSLLDRAVTLATEASNGTLNSSQEAAANEEYTSILSEINNIGSTTTYNQEQVFAGKTVAIYTGDSSTKGSSINELNISTLSESCVGDTDGRMSYSTGQDNVFIDLSTSAKNASVNDSLNASGATSITVSYLTGSSSSTTTATATISVGSGTNYQNTAQGLISAINDAGLGITASFGTAANAGTAATSTAAAADETNSALGTGPTDTGIIISGTGVGVNSTGADGAGEVGTLTVSQSTDTLGGTLTVVGSDGTSHAITLGTANSTDTLANLASTINSAGYGVTAAVNASSVTGQNGATHAAGTVLTFTTANSTVTVNTANAADTQASTTALTMGATSGVADTAGYVLGSFTAGSATDTLTGILSFTNMASTTPVVAATTTDFNLNGGTLSSIFGAGGTASSYLTAAGITATLTNNNTVVTFTQTATNTGTAGQTSAAVGVVSAVQDSAATGSAVVKQTAAVAIGTAAATSFGTITATNANDTFNSGTITITGGGGVSHALTLGIAGSTDNLVDLAKTINGETGAVTATLDSTGTILTLATTAALTTAVPTITSSSVSSTLALSGTPTVAGTSSSTVLGTLALPTNSTNSGSSSDTLSGTLTFGTESITLGTSTGSAKTDTMADLAATINAGTYGVKATLNSAGTAITFTSADSDNATASTVLPSTAAANSTTSLPYLTSAYDHSLNGGTQAITTDLTFTKANNNVTSSAYYSIGISSVAGITDVSTGGGTGTVGMSADSDGASGIATTSYSDAAGISLASTSLLSTSDAETALTDLNVAITDVAAMDGYIGAQINTLNSVSSVLTTQQENVTSAQNAIQATDYAAATSAMSKYEILSQTGIAALAQANSVQQEVTKLLQ
jgi:flagellin